MWKRSKRRINRTNGKSKIPRLSRILIVLLLILIPISAYFFINSNFFIIKKIDIVAQNTTCATERELKDSTELLGMNLIFINFTRVKNELKEKFICIKSTEIARFFPDKVRLQVFGREPVANLISLQFEEATGASIIEQFASKVASDSADTTTEEVSDAYLVDSEGVIFAKNLDQVNIPKLFIYEQSLSLGLKITQDLIKNSILIFNKLKTFGVEVKDARIYSKELLLINGEPRIIFRLLDNVDIQIASLQLILNKAKIDKDLLEFIDLRFDKPVIRFAPKKK